MGSREPRTAADRWREAFNRVANRAELAEERLSLARLALVDTGYFTADEVGEDVAPRITELWAARAAGGRVVNHRMLGSDRKDEPVYPAESTPPATPEAPSTEAGRALRIRIAEVVSGEWGDGLHGQAAVEEVDGGAALWGGEIAAIEDEAARAASEQVAALREHDAVRLARRYIAQAVELTEPSPEYDEWLRDGPVRVRGLLWAIDHLASPAPSPAPWLHPRLGVVELKEGWTPDPAPSPVREPLDPHLLAQAMHATPWHQHGSYEDDDDTAHDIAEAYARLSDNP